MSVDVFAKTTCHILESKNLVILEAPLEERVNITYQEYVIEAQSHYIQTFGQDVGLQKWFEYVITSLTKMKKRLGGLAYQNLVALVQQAYDEQLHSGLHRLILHGFISYWLIIMILCTLIKWIIMQIKSSLEAMLLKSKSIY